jgi:hypothetical protein
MKTHGGVEVSGQLHAPAALPQRKSGHCKQKTRSPAIQPVAILTEL